MVNREVPQDIEAERAVIGSALVWRSGIPEIVATGLTAGDFLTPAHGDIWAAVVQADVRGDPFDATTLVADGFDQATVMACQADSVGTGSAGRLARLLVEHATRRRLIAAAAAASGAAFAAEDIRQIVAILESAVADAMAATPIESAPARPFADEGDAPYDWVVPGLIERGDRIILTGGEGAGKTVLVVQIAVQVAAGIHPTTKRSIPPARVLYVDLELGNRRIARHLNSLLAKAGPLEPDQLRVISRPEGIDLLGGDAAWLGRQLSAHPADLVCIGPVYKLHGAAQRGDVGGEGMTKEVVQLLDRIRVRYGVALLMESHAPHADGAGGERTLRPFGSSVWLRWPDFGYGLRRDQDAPPGVVQYNLEAWRGPRDDRQWPTAFQRGGHWPWTPHWPEGMPREEEEF